MLLGQERTLDDKKILDNASEENLSPVLLFGRKRKFCGQIAISSTQPAPNTETKKDWCKDYKYQKALVKKQTKTIERHVKTIERLNKKLGEVSKQGKLLMDIVNRKF